MIETAPHPFKLAEEVDSYLFLLKDLVWKILQDSEELPSLKKRFGQLFKNGYPDSLQLPKAYSTLIAHLLHLDPVSITPEQFPNGTALLDTLGWCHSREIPEPVEIAELGVLWMILGVRLKNEVLQRAGLKVAVWSAHLLDGYGRPHLSTWSRASSFKLSSLSLWHHALFTIAYRITGERAFSHIAQVAQEESWNPEAFPIKLLVLVPSTMTPSIPNPYHPFAEESTVGLMKFSTTEMSMIAQVSGWNSGLFSFHKKEVAIVNAGPQMGAFDDLSKFGITRTWGTKHRPFQEMTWEKTAYHCRLKGWTKLSAAPVWVELDARLQAGQAVVEMSFQEKTLQESLSFVLFLKCDKLILGGKHHLETGTLEMYDGKAIPLELQGPSEKMVIAAENGISMKVIPLAGGDHFWGAKFLVAFSVANSFSLNVK